MTRLRGYLLFLGVLATASPTKARCQSAIPPVKTSAQVEDIYVAHAVRISRGAPTVLCDSSRIGFGRALFEDRFALRSIQVRAADGLVVNTDAQPIGTMHACFGATADSAMVNFHAEGSLATVAFLGKGECLAVKRDFPESGLTVMRCFLELGNLPVGYTGGHLTSNTILSRVAVGAVSEPEGYTQPSIVTVRLWKHR